LILNGNEEIVIFKINIIIILISASLLIVSDPESKLHPTLPEGMVYVPAGSFIFGSNLGDVDESPQQIAETGAYFIDRYEVSNADFKKFDHKFTFKGGYDNHAAAVTWEQANAYAKWIGKRLPSEREWEKAARGIDGRLYPWGNTYDHTFANWDESYPRGGSAAKPESPYGCIDMAGGAWEWTSDWYQPYPGNNVPSRQYGEKYKVMRGGASFNGFAMMRTTHRYYLPTNTTGNYYTGFRCVKDVE
jgi:formylglycine-generating enzyme required for sulfatase activity